MLTAVEMHSSLDELSPSRSDIELLLFGHASTLEATVQFYSGYYTLFNFVGVLWRLQDLAHREDGTYYESR